MAFKTWRFSSQPRLIDAVPHEAKLLDAMAVGIDGDLYADLSGAKQMEII